VAPPGEAAVRAAAVARVATAATRPRVAVLTDKTPPGWEIQLVGGDYWEFFTFVARVRFVKREKVVRVQPGEILRQMT
jgi:hypothetical protein